MPAVTLRVAESVKGTVQMCQSFSKMHITVPVQWQLRSQRRHLAYGKSGHVRIVKVKPTLTKVLLELGCLYLAIIMNNYSRSIVPVKKLQFPPWKTDKFENIRVCSCADMPHHEGACPHPMLLCP